MDVERARALLAAKRAEVQKLLAETETAGWEDRGSEDEKGTDVADPAQSLTQQGMDDAIAESLKDRLAALERAEQRLAAFLLNLVQRLHARGFSRTELVLRMTREEIGSYLGLTLETVSRTLSAFNEIGLITVDQRTIGIKDPEALKTLRRLPPSRSRAKQNAKHKADAESSGDGAVLATA